MANNSETVKVIHLLLSGKRIEFLFDAGKEEAWFTLFCNSLAAFLESQLNSSDFENLTESYFGPLTIKVAREETPNHPEIAVLDFHHHLDENIREMLTGQLRYNFQRSTFLQRLGVNLMLRLNDVDSDLLNFSNSNR